MKLYIKHILFFGLALGMTSCVETMKDGDMSTTGFLGVPVLDADIQVEEFGATKAVPSLPTLSVPDHSKLHFKVTGSDSKVVWNQDGRWSNPLKMPVGEYTIEVNYGSNTYRNPWYKGTCTGNISAVTEAVPAIGLRLYNSLLAVVLSDGFKDHFTPSEGNCVTISSTSGSITTTLDNYVFVPAEEALTIEVRGKSSAGVDKTLSWTLKPLSAATATYVTCSLTTNTTDIPTITMSEIPAADAWGNTAYVPLATTANISPENVAEMQYFASSNDWANSDEGTIVDIDRKKLVKFTGLKPGATYKVRAQLGALKSNEVSMTMSTSALSIEKSTIAHTYTNDELDGTDFTASFSVAKKFGVTESSLQLCNSDGDVLRTVALKGTSAEWTSDGSALTGDDIWPFLPVGSYIIKGTATQSGSSVTLEEYQFTVPTPDFEVIVTGTTTYDLYSSGKIKEANEADAESITGIGYQVKIAQALKDNSKYNYSDTFTLDEVDVKGTSSKSGQSWANHPLVATVSFAGEVKTVKKDCYITGLPFNSSKSNPYYNWQVNQNGGTITGSSVVLKGASSASNSSYLMSSKIITPSSINATITLKAQNDQSLSTSTMNLYYGTTTNTEKPSQSYSFSTKNSEKTFSGSITIDNSYFSLLAGGIQNKKITISSLVIQYKQ